MTQKYSIWMDEQLESLPPGTAPKPPTRQLLARWLSDAYWTDISDDDIKTGMHCCTRTAIPELPVSGVQHYITYWFPVRSFLELPRLQRG
jgi:hypothetical protein